MACRLAELRWNQFLIADYGSAGASGCGPYAQTSRQPGGFYCEVAGRDVVGRSWELDVSALELQGWSPPDASTGNWWWVADSSELEAAELLLRSLVDAWGCVDPGLVSLTVGQHSTPGWWGTSTSGSRRGGSSGSVRSDGTATRPGRGLCSAIGE